MPTDFPNPQNALVAWNWETIQGVPVRTGWHDVSNWGAEKFGNTPKPIPRGNIASGEEVAPLPGKIEAAAMELKLDTINPSSDYGWLLWWFGAGVTSTLETGAYLHRLSPKGSGYTAPPTISVQVNRDDGMPQIFANNRCSQMAFALNAGALQPITMTVVGRGGDYWGDAIRSVGTGLVYPIFRGFVPSQFLGDLTQNLWIKVVAQTTTTLTFKAKLGDADAYGSNQTVTRGVWTQIADEAGVMLGSPGNHGELFPPLGGTFVADDEFQIPMTRVVRTPSFPANTVITEVYSAMTIDGVEEEAKTMALTLKKGSQAVSSYGGQLAKRTQERGLRTASGTISRDVKDTSMRRRLELNQPFKLVIYMRSGVPIGTTGNLDFSLKIIAANCVVTGTTPSIESATAYTDSVSFTCHPGTDGTYPEGVYAELINDIPDLAAA